ncbi:MAG: hypothetical protein K940chlam2_00004 [Chlamydiae bacterium]|nr:hypothetical protein [Chlamydiota bacterium]
MEPMGIGAAIEVIKILKPYVDELVEAEDGPALISILSKGFARDKTDENIGRLLALMEGKSFKEISERLAENPEVSIVFMNLAEAFSVNPIPDLIDAGLAMGLLNRGWTDAS